VRIRIMRLVVVLVMATLIAGVVGVSGAVGEKESIKIGMTISTSGNYAYASLSGFKGVQIWVEDVNNRGGIYVKEFDKKLPVDLKYYDDRSDKATVARLYEKLINEDKVDILFAPFGSTLTSAAAAITEKHGKILNIWSAASDSIYEQGYQYVISATEVPCSLMPKPEIEHMHSLGVTSVAIIYNEEPFNAGQAQYAKIFAENLGIHVAQYEKFSTGMMDFTMLLEKARRSNADALYASAYLGDLINLIKQMKELDLMFDYTYMVYSGQLELWVEALGDDGLYIFGHTLWHPDLVWPMNTGLTRDAFGVLYAELFPQERAPDYQTSLAYGAGPILEEMIKKAGTLEADALKQAALDLSGELVVVTGPYKIDETGKQLLMPFSIIQVNKNSETGEYEHILVWPEEIVTGETVYPIPSWQERSH